MLQRPARAQQGLIGLDGGARLGTTELRGRFGDQGNTQAVKRRSEPFAIPNLTHDDQRTRCTLQRRRQRRQLGLARKEAAVGQRLGRRGLGDRDLARRRHEGLSKRKVQVHRAARSFRDCTRGEAAPHPRRIRHLDRDARIDEPPHGGAEEMLLVDRLVGPHSLQLWRAVRGDDDQGSARVRRLDDRGMKLRRGCARGRQDHRGLARRLTQADRKERAASLVDMDDDLDPRMPLEGHRDRRRARARRHACELNALRRQLVDEGGGEALSDVSHRIDS